MFRVALFKNGQQAADKTYAVRSLPAGEVLALRGDCASHRKMFEQARPLVEQAVQAEPKMAISHEALGYYLYRKEDRSGADREMKKAMELGSTSFVAPYYHGLLVLQGGLAAPEMMQEAIKSLERATQLNPQFAPAFEGLAQAYSLSPETQKQALEAGIRAVQLEPATHAYAINLVYLLSNANRDADARQLAQRILERAASPEETQEARALLERIKVHEQWVAQIKAQSEAAASVTAKTAAGASAPAAQPASASSTAMAVKRWTMVSRASSQETGVSLPSLRRRGWVARPGAVRMWCSLRPLGQSLPRLTGWSGLPRTVTALPSLTPTNMPQPTEQ